MTPFQNIEEKSRVALLSPHKRIAVGFFKKEEKESAELDYLSMLASRQSVKLVNRIRISADMAITLKLVDDRDMRRVEKARQRRTNIRAIKDHCVDYAAAHMIHGGVGPMPHRKPKFPNSPLMVANTNYGDWSISGKIWMECETPKDHENILLGL